MADVRGPRAEDLPEGVPFVRGWADARAAAEELAVELKALGLEDAFCYMKADVNAFGQGFVRLERVTSEAGQVFVRALMRGLCEEIARASEAVDPADGTSAAG